MKNDPKDRGEEEDDPIIDIVAREVAEQLDGYKDYYMREVRGGSLNFGDY